MAGVPRIFEKIYQGANAKAKAGGGAKAKIFDWAFTTSANIKAKQRAGPVRRDRSPGRRWRSPTSSCSRRSRP